MNISRNYIIIIPARSGSKRLPNKNKMNLNGFPLIDWTINAAIHSKVSKEIYISTDDNDITKMYSSNSSVKTLNRPSHLATDQASTIDVVLDILKELDSKNERHIVLLQPTSPLRTADHIKSAIHLYEKNQCSSLFSATCCDHPPQWTFNIDQNNKLIACFGEDLFSSKSQNLSKTFRLNGAIYIAKEEFLKKEKKFISFADSFPFLMDQLSSVDIDTHLDFKLAELILNSKISDS